MTVLGAALTPGLYRTMETSPRTPTSMRGYSRTAVYGYLDIHGGLCPLIPPLLTYQFKTSPDPSYRTMHFAMSGPYLLRTISTRSPFKADIHQVTRPFYRQPLLKTFSTSRYQAMLTTELSEAEISALKVDKDRLAKDLHHSCQWGNGIRWGE